MLDHVEFAYTDLPVKSLPSSSRSRLISRPIIPLIILYKDKFVQYQALLDTGADYNVFHADIAVYLGINLTKGRCIKITGIGGDSIKGYEHKVDIKVGHKRICTTIVFSRQIPNNAIAVLGNQGFFNHFIVEFDYNSKKLSIT